MPRTKVSKSSKRNRETEVQEERIREFERSLEVYLNELDFKGNTFIAEIESDLDRLMERTPDAVLNAPLSSILELDLSKLSDFDKILANGETSHRGSQLNTMATSSVNDDGYITEDSGNSGSSAPLATFLSMTQRGRTPGPLSSARARSQRRSRSACSDNLTRSKLARSVQNSEHAPRNKLRTPGTTRPKAFSADRSIKNQALENEQTSPACAFFRWPKPGELVVSTHGSPLVAAVVPDRFANVNIPMEDGVLSLKPKKLAEVDTHFMKKFDAKTLQEIKTLQESLDKIVALVNNNKN